MIMDAKNETKNSSSGFNSDGWHDIHIAASTHNISALEEQLLKNVSVDLQTVDGNEYTPLILAVQRPWTTNDADKMMQLLFEHKADPNKQAAFGVTALMEAAVERSPVAVRLLLDRKADRTVRSFGRTALDFIKDGYGPQVNEIITMLEARPAPEAPPAPFPKASTVSTASNGLKDDANDE